VSEELHITALYPNLSGTMLPCIDPQGEGGHPVSMAAQRQKNTMLCT